MFFRNQNARYAGTRCIIYLVLIQCVDLTGPRRVWIHTLSVVSAGMVLPRYVSPSKAFHRQHFLLTSDLVRAANSKLLGTKILELPKPFRVQTWKYLKNFSEVRTYLNSKFEFQVFPSLLENTLRHFLLLFNIIKRNVWSSSKFFSMFS